MQNVFTAFKNGFLNPSLKILGAAALFFGAFVVVINQYGAEVLLSRFSMEQLLTAPHDQMTHAAYQLAEWRRKQPENSLILLGGSALREAIVTPEAFERETAVFGTVNQSFAEGRLLVSELPKAKDSKSDVVIAVTPWSFSFAQKTVEDYRKEFWLLSSHSNLKSYAAAYWNNHQNTLKRASLPQTNFKFHLYEGREPFSEEMIQVRLQQVGQMRAAHLSENAGFHEEQLKLLVAEVLKKGYRVRLIEAPMLPLAQEHFKDVLLAHDERMQRLRMDLQVSYSPVGLKMEWQDGDFYDLAHLTSAGQEKFQAYLIELLKEHQEMGVAVSESAAPSAAG